jgi:hypothetical protein
MTRRWFCIVVAVLCGLLAPLVGGCAPAISQRYYPSAKNAIALRNLAALSRSGLWSVSLREGPTRLLAA